MAAKTEKIAEKNEKPAPSSLSPADGGGSKADGGPGGGGSGSSANPEQRIEMPESSPNSAEIFCELIGRFKRYQFMVFVLCASGKFATACNMFAINFFTPDHSYTCGGVKNKCPCSNPVWDHSIFEATVISDFNLICERKAYKSYIQSIFQLGVFFGSYIFGAIADRWGRRPSLIIASIILMLTSITASLAPNVYVFLAHRLVIGISTGGAIVVGFICMNEILHPKDRDLVAPCFFLSFNFFAIIVPIVAYFFRDWRQLQFFSGCTSFIMAPMLCFLPESPRWLIAEAKYERAIKVIEKLRKCNNLPHDMVREDVMKMQGIAQKAMKVRFFDLFTHARMCRYFIIMCIAFFSVSYFFYGVSQFVGRLAGNIYFNTLFNASATFVGVACGVPIMYILKRKPLFVSLFFIAFLNLSISGLFDIPILHVILATVSTIADFTAFNLGYIYAAELYPTVIRSTAMGVNSMCARIGSMIAPFTIEMDNKSLRPFMFAIPPLISGICCLFLDETKGHELPATVEELEQQHNKNK